MARLRNGSTHAWVALAAAGLVLAGVVLGVVLIAVHPGSGNAPATTAAGCSLPTGMVAYQELQCHPEAELFYPGAKVYQRLGESESSSAIGGSNPAFSGAILISSDSVSQIYKWYDAWLTRNGWYRAPLLGAGYVSAHGYARTPGREAFNVDIDNPAQLSATLGQQVPAGGTLFEVRYILFQASQTPHTPAPSCPTTPEPRGLGSTFYCNP